MIIGTEYAEEVGGGTSQVATTVFNAAWEAGLRITERNPHALYISRYQLGRDATVYWPSLDLKFVNDTKRWVLVKGFVEYDGIVVSIYGGEDRRVDSSEGTMEITGPVVVEREKDPTLPRGETVVEEEGTPPSTTSVTRTIYDRNGTELRTETWNTSYKSHARIVRVGTKPPKPAKPPARGSQGPGGRRSEDTARRAHCALLLRSRNRLGKPSGHAYRPIGLAIDGRVAASSRRRPARRPRVIRYS